MILPVKHVLHPPQHAQVVMLQNKENLMDQQVVYALMATMRTHLSYVRDAIYHVQHVQMGHHVLLVLLRKIQQKMQSLGSVIVRIRVSGIPLHHTVMLAITDARHVIL